ncbi:MAG: DUF84 family protein [Candidatus Heimdallarchaeaceae archaeon]
MKVVICSTNPVKIEAVKEAFSSFFENIVYFPLEMSNHKEILRQPMSSKETLSSAVKRVQVARKEESAEFFVSMEGGMDSDDHGAFLTWYVCVGNNSGKDSIAGGGRMPLPKPIYEELVESRTSELGDIMDRITNEENVKQRGGSTAVFTGNRIFRKDVFTRDLIIALIPFTSDIFQKIERKEKI